MFKANRITSDSTKINDVHLSSDRPPASTSERPKEVHAERQHDGKVGVCRLLRNAALTTLAVSLTVISVVSYSPKTAVNATPNAAVTTRIGEGNSNYYVSVGGAPITGLKVKLVAESDIKIPDPILNTNDKSDGFSIQINGYPPDGNTVGWLQLTVMIQPAYGFKPKPNDTGNSLSLLACAWPSVVGAQGAASNQTLERVSYNLPSIIPRGYSFEIDLINNSKGDVTGYTLVYRNDKGDAITKTTMHLSKNSAVLMGGPITQMHPTPIVAFTTDVVGICNGGFADFNNAKADLLMSASQPLSASIANFSYGNHIFTGDVFQSGQPVPERYTTGEDSNLHIYEENAPKGWNLAELLTTDDQK
jgi:hypothetical protein